MLKAQLPVPQKNLVFNIVDYTAAPIFTPHHEGHEWLIEFEKNPDNLEEFVKSLDHFLKLSNSDYEGKRKRRLSDEITQSESRSLWYFSLYGCS